MILTSYLVYPVCCGREMVDISDMDSINDEFVHTKGLKTDGLPTQAYRDKVTGHFWGTAKLNSCNSKHLLSIELQA
jgi:hypothetical protein